VEREPHDEDATRRTHLAQERTLLAWWRSGLAGFAVAIGTGRVVPGILDVSPAPFVALGVAFGLLGLAFVSIGAHHDRAVTRQLAEGRFEPLDRRVVWSVTIVLIALGVGSIAVLVFAS
jgi:uncharacterized membrane protein YidH (DUF202 family)